MENDEMITLEVVCINYEIEPSFIDSLLEYGLLEITTVENTRFLEMKRIRDLERWIHLHYDLDINLEGIQTISHLLERVTYLQDELSMLRNRLQFYENL